MNLVDGLQLRLRVRSPLLMVAIAMLQLVVDVASLSDDEVVAARLVVCQQCRLGELVEVHRFVSELLPNYASLSLVDRPSAEPVLMYVNRFQQTVDSVSIRHMTTDEIVADLVEHGIFLWSPAPQFDPLPIEPTQSCIAWRQTAGCKATGSREPLMDERCTVRIPFDRSGYCECSPGVHIPLDCDHDEGSCDQYCEQRQR